MSVSLQNLMLTVLFSLSYVSAQVQVSSQVQVIPQVADGGGWRSTVVLTNTTASDTTATLTFYMDTTGGATQQWAPTFLEANSAGILVVPAGSSLFLHTPGTASTVFQGWAQVITTPGVVGYVVYTYSSPGRADQDATAPAGFTASRILVPFDNTNGLITALAVVNPNPSSLSISANFKTMGGAVTTGSLPNIPGQGQMAFLMPNQLPGTAGLSGLAEFYTNSGSFAIIALRANPTGAFTSAPVYFETGPPIISTGGSTVGQ